MALFRKLRNLKKAKAERSKERQKPKESAKQKPVASEAMLLAKGALGYPAFIEACERHGIRGNEKISVLFEQLYKWFSQSPALSALEAELELEAKIKQPPVTDWGNLGARFARDSGTKEITQLHL